MTEAEKIKKIKKIRDDFLKKAAGAQKQLNILRARQFRLLEEMIKKRDKDKINKILNSIK